MSVQNEKRFYKNVQLITTDLEGVILHSDANLFPNWKEKTSIYDAHPFFEIIRKSRHKRFLKIYFYP